MSTPVVVRSLDGFCVSFLDCLLPEQRFFLPCFFLYLNLCRSSLSGSLLTPHPFSLIPFPHRCRMTCLSHHPGVSGSLGPSSEIRRRTTPPYTSEPLLHSPCPSPQTPYLFGTGLSWGHRTDPADWRGDTGVGPRELTEIHIGTRVDGGDPSGPDDRDTGPFREVSLIRTFRSSRLDVPSLDGGLSSPARVVRVRPPFSPTSVMENRDLL